VHLGDREPEPIALAENTLAVVQAILGHVRPVADPVQRIIPLVLGEVERALLVDGQPAPVFP
jgi:hypothetical protein